MTPKRAGFIDSKCISKPKQTRGKQFKKVGSQALKEGQLEGLIPTKNIYFSEIYLIAGHFLP